MMMKRIYTVESSLEEQVLKWKLGWEVFRMRKEGERKEGQGPKTRQVESCSSRILMIMTRKGKEIACRTGSKEKDRKKKEEKERGSSS